MTRHEQWAIFTYDPGNSFQNLVFGLEGFDPGDMGLFLFHQLRTERGHGGMLEEGKDGSSSLRVMNTDAAKIVKGEKKGVLSGILYLAAGDSAGVEVCPFRTGKYPTWRHKGHPGSNIVYGKKNKSGECVSIKDAEFHLSDEGRASDYLKDAVKQANKMDPMAAMAYLDKMGFNRDAGCSGLCLGHTAGHARVAQSKKDDLESNPIQRVRIDRTQRLLARGEVANKQFLDDVIHDINLVIRKAERQKMMPAVRLNGTSDLFWHSMGKLKKDGKTIYELFPNIQFYDYTKNLSVAMDFLHGRLPANYHVTYSFGGSNWPQAKKVLDKGGNVAVGFRLRKKDGFPLSWRGYEVIDGDETDLRFADPTSVPGKIVGLRTKGSSFTMDSEFIVEPGDPDIVWPQDSPFHPSQGGKGVEEIKKARAARETTAAKYVIADQIEQDIAKAFQMIRDGHDLTLNELQKRTKIPMRDLKNVYTLWSKRLDLTSGSSKVLPKDADRSLTAKNIRNLFQLLSRRAMTAKVYEPSMGMEGSDLRNYIKGHVKVETFAEYLGMDHLVEVAGPGVDPTDCPDWPKLDSEEKEALAILVKQHNEDPDSWKVALGIGPVAFGSLLKKGLAEKQVVDKVASYRLACPHLLGKEKVNGKRLNALQARGMGILKRADERSRQPGADPSTQWVAPSAYEMKASTFETLHKLGLAERKMNPGRDSNRWLYRLAQNDSEK